MNLLNEFLALGVVIGTLASVLVLFVVFVAWIWSLESDLNVQAPLLDDRLPNPSIPSEMGQRLRGTGATRPAMVATQYK